MKLETNLKAMFAFESIPSDTHMRDVMDEIDSEELKPVFGDFFGLLQRGKYLEEYRVFDKYYFCVIHGGSHRGRQSRAPPSLSRVRWLSSCHLR